MAATKARIKGHPLAKACLAFDQCSERTVREIQPRRMRHGLVLLRHQILSMNTLSGGWIGDDLVAELASQSVQNAVLGFQYPGLVLSHTCLDEIEAFDHHAPEECG